MIACLLVRDPTMLIYGILPVDPVAMELGLLSLFNLINLIKNTCYGIIDPNQ